MPIEVGKIQANYEGSIDLNRMRIGNGEEKFRYNNEQETYNGRFFRDSYHGQGFYYTRPAFGTAWSYEGSFYSNSKHGVGMISYGNNTYFIGLFKNDEAFGPGMWCESNGGQNIGFWKGPSLIRLIYPVGEVKQLSTTPYNKFRVLRYRRLINGNPVVRDYAAETMEQFHASPNLVLISERLQAIYSRNPQSHLFMRKQFDDVYMDDLIPAEVLFTLIRSVSVNTIYELREKLNEFAAPVSEQSSVDRIPSEDSKKNKKPEKKRKKGRKESIISLSPSEMDQTLNAVSKNQIIKRSTSMEDRESKMLLEPMASMMSSTIISKPKSDVAMNLVDLSESQSTLYLMAWNNSQIMVDMLMHAFINRNSNCPIPMNFGLIMCGRREKFGSKKGYLEEISKKFLKACSAGNINMIKELAYTWRVDVNLTDSKGNSCLLRAVEADNHPLIKLLILYGADPDIMNDEGFSTITHCLTRYLAIKKNITNWGDAFLPPADFVPTDNVQQWMFDKNAVDMKSGPVTSSSNKKVRPSMTEEYIFDFTPPTPVDTWSEIFHMLDKKQKQGSKKRKEQKDKKDKKKMNKNWLFNEETLLDSESVMDAERRRSTGASLVLTTDEIIENKLATIEQTIQLLANIGGNLNVSEVPAPVILLAILTGMKEIVEVLLQQGVDPNARLLKEQKSGNLTPMHVMVLSPPLETYPDILKLLLKYGGNANLLTSESFDMAAQELLLGKLDRSLFEPVRGMTPIQALCLRVDAERQQNILPILEEMLQILIPASLNSFRPSYRYLGHTPLSLAIVRGNSLFVKLLLEAKHLVDPNEYLGTYLGNALAVLMRYLGISPLFSNYQMMLNLLKEGANPLRKVHLEDGHVGNLFDLLKDLQMAMVAEFFEEMHKQGVSEFKKEVLPKKAKKKKEVEKKPRVPTLSKEFQLKHAEFQCKLAILENQCRAKIHRRIRGRLLKELLLKIQNRIGSIELHTALLIERMRLWFTPDSFVNTVKDGVALGNFCLSKADADIALSILFPVVIKRHKEFKKDIKSLKKLEKQQRQMKVDVFNLLENTFQYCSELKKSETEHKMGKKYNIRLISRNTDLYPELDSSEDLYKVCYNCLQRNRPLEVCPRCGLVYFCSEFCNMLDVAREDPIGHNCGVRFYGLTKPEQLNLASLGLLRGRIYEDFKGSPWDRDKIDIDELMEGRDHESFLVGRAEYFDRFMEQEERRRIIMAEKEEQRQAYEKELEAIKAKLLAEEEALRQRLEKETEQELLKEEEMKEAELKMQQEKQRKEMEQEDKKEERERAIQQMLSLSQAKKEGLTDILAGIKEHSLGELQTLSDKLLELRGEMSDEKLDELLLLSLLEGTAGPEEDRAKESEEQKSKEQLTDKEEEKDKSIEDKVKKKETEKSRKEKQAKKAKEREEEEKRELEKREKELQKTRKERKKKLKEKKEKEARDKFAEKTKKEKEKQQQILDKAKKDRIKGLEKLARAKFIAEKDSKEEIKQTEIEQREDQTALEEAKKEKEKAEVEMKKVQEQEALKEIAKLEKEAMQEMKEQERDVQKIQKHTPPVKEKHLTADKQTEEKEKRERLQVPSKPSIQKDVDKAVKEQPKIAVKTKEELAKPPPPKVEAQIPKKPVIITDKGEIRPPEISAEVKADDKAPVKADVKAPVKADDKAPVKADVKAPVKADVKAPVKADVKASVKADVKAPVKADVKAPVKADVKAPVEADVKASVKADVKAPVKADVKAPIKAEIKAPLKAPVKEDVKPPVEADVKAPIKTEIKAPLKAPVKEDVKKGEVKAVTDYKVDVDKVTAKEPEKMVVPTKPVAKPKPRTIVPAQKATPEVPKVKQVQPQEMVEKPKPVLPETGAEPTPKPQDIEHPKDKLQPEEMLVTPAPIVTEAKRPGTILSKPTPQPAELITAKLEERPEHVRREILVTHDAVPGEPMPAPEIVETPRDKLQLKPEETSAKPAPPKVLPSELAPTIPTVQPPSKEFKARPAPTPSKAVRTRPAPKPEIVQPTKQEIRPQQPAPGTLETLLPEPVLKLETVETPKEKSELISQEIAPQPAPVPSKVLPPPPVPVPKTVEPPRGEVKPTPPGVTVKPAPVPSKVLPPSPAPGPKVVETPREEVRPTPPGVTVKPAPVPSKVLPPSPAPVPKVVETPREEVKPTPPGVTVKPAPVPSKVLPPSPAPVPKVVEPPREEVRPTPPGVTVKPAPVPSKVLPPSPAPGPKVIETPREEVKPTHTGVTVKPAPVPSKVLPPSPAPGPKVVETPREEVRPTPPGVTVKPAPVPSKVLPPSPAPGPKVIETPREEVKPTPPGVTVKPAPVPSKVLPPSPAPGPKVVETPREEVKPTPPGVTVKPTPVPSKVLPPSPAPGSKVVETPREEVRPTPTEVIGKPAPVSPKVLPPPTAPAPEVAEHPKEELKPIPLEVTIKPTPVPTKILPTKPAPEPKVTEPPREVKPTPPGVTVKPAPVPSKVLPPSPAPGPKVVETPREEVRPTPPGVTVKPAPVPSKVLPPSPAPVPKVVETPREEVKPTPPGVTVKPAPVPSKVLPPSPAPGPKVVETPREEVRPTPPGVTVKPAPVPSKVLPPSPAPGPKVVETPREEVRPTPPGVTVKPAPVPSKVLPPSPAPVPKVVEPREVTVKPAPVPSKVLPPTPAPVPKVVEPREVIAKPAPVPPKVLPPTPAPVAPLVRPSVPPTTVGAFVPPMLGTSAPPTERPIVQPPVPTPIPDLVELRREEVKPRPPEGGEELVRPGLKPVPPQFWPPEAEVWPKIEPLRQTVRPRPYETPPSVSPRVSPPPLATKSRIIGPEEGVLEYLKQRAMKAKELPRFPVPKDRVPEVPLRRIPDFLQRRELSEIEIVQEPKEPLEKEIRAKPIKIKPTESDTISIARRPSKRRWEEVAKSDKLEKPVQVMSDTALPFAYEPEDLRRRLRLEEDIEGGYIIPVEGQELEVGKKIVRPLAGFIYRPIETYIIDYGEPKIKRARPSKKEKIILEDFGRRPPFFHKFVSAIHPHIRYKIDKGYGVQYMINRLTGKPHRFIAWDELEKRFPEDSENLQSWAHIATEPPSIPERVAEEEFIPPYKEPSYEPYASFRFDRRGQFTWSEPPPVIKEEDMKNVPLHIQELMFRMASLLGPDADLGFLFPFVVIRNGELFYKFYGDTTIVENYSLN